MKKLLALIKKILGIAKTVTLEEKKEAEAIAEGVIKALDEVKAKKQEATVPAAVVGEAPKTPKKKKKYYKPKPKQA